MRAQLKQHPHACGECSRAFPSAALLAKHTSAHDVVCPQCDERGPSATHARMFHGAHACTKCALTFASAARLLAHAEGHTMYAPTFACGLCGWGAVSDADVRTHVREAHPDMTVAGWEEAPLEAAHASTIAVEAASSDSVCKECRRAFVYRASLENHKCRVGSAKFKCDECDAAFTTQRWYNAHRLHHKKRLGVNCARCTYSDRTDAGVRRHVRDHHYAYTPRSKR